jgi:hypothetical protein
MEFSMFPLFSTEADRAAVRGLFSVLPYDQQNAVMQHMYDDGLSGVKIGKVLGVGDVYQRITSHRGRRSALEIAMV